MLFQLYKNKSKYDARAELLVNVTEEILCYMEDNDISIRELAYETGKSHEEMCQVLNGCLDLTFKDFADICYALGIDFEIKIG